FEDTGLISTDRLPERVGDGSFKAGIILHRDEVRMILSEPRQHASVNLAVEVVHHERAKDGDLMLVGEVVELILKGHARSHVPSFPQEVHHLAPPTNLGVAAPTARPGDDLPCQ